MVQPVEAFLASAVRAFRLRGPVYRLGLPTGGSPDNEAALRACLPEAAWFDVDLEDGVEAGCLPFSDGAARTVLCDGALGHAFEPRRAMEEMERLLAPGGAILIYAQVANALPDRPPAYWHPTPRSVQRLLAAMAATVVGWQGADTFPHTVYGIGLKSPTRGAVLDQTRQFLGDFQARLGEMARGGGWSRRLRDWMGVFARTPLERRHHREYYQVQFAVHAAMDRAEATERSADLEHPTKTGGRLDLIQ